MDESELRMNLAALQRNDPYIKAIIDSSSQVALYQYAEDAWDKTGIEGTLFVYERRCEPFYGFLVLNRLGSNNCIQPLTDSIQHQIQPPFILYKTKDSEIFGLWFYEEAKCREIGATLAKYIEISDQQKQQQQQGANANAPSSKMDLGSLLNKTSDKAAAAKELDNHRNQRGDISLRTTKDSPSSGGEKLLRMLASAGGGGGGGRGADDSRVSQQAVNGGSGSGGDAKPAPAAPTSSVVEFFAQASQAQPPPPPPALMGSPTQVGGPPPGPAGGPEGGSGPPPGIVRPVVGPHPAGIIPIMHGLPPGMALLPQQPGAPPVVVPLIRPGPPPMTVGSPPGGVPPGGVIVTAASSGFQPMVPAAAAAAPPLPQHQNPTGPLNVVSHEPPIQHHPPSAIHSLLSNPGTVSVEALERTQREESRTPPPPNLSSSSSHMSQRHNNSKDHHHHHSSSNVDLESDLKTKLNIMGGGGKQQRKSPSAASSSQQQQQQSNKPQQTSGKSKRRSPKVKTPEPELLSPKAFTQAAAAAAATTAHATSNGGGIGNIHAVGGGDNSHTEPLTQGQMVQAMQHLLRTDKTFVAKLHQAYIDSLNNKLN